MGSKSVDEVAKEILLKVKNRDNDSPGLEQYVVKDSGKSILNPFFIYLWFYSNLILILA